MVKKNKKTTWKKGKKTLAIELNTDHPNVKSSPRLLCQVTKLILIRHSKLFNAFAHEILPVHAVWSWRSSNYQGFKDIFKETKKRFDSNSPTLTHFLTVEEYIMANSQSVSSCRVAVPCICMRRIGRNSPTVNILTIFSSQRKKNISAFHCTQWKLCCLETLMQLNITINDVTAATYQGQLVFPPHCAIHTHSTTDTKFDNIINSLHKESKPKIEF